MAYFNFATWDDAPQAKPFYLDENPNLAGYNCAPQVFYFRPQKKWYLIFQSPQPRFSTADDISKPETWSAPQNFFAGTPKSVTEGWLDYWIICDDTHAYLFFPDDHGRFYRSRTRLEDFPRGFSEPVVVMQEKNPSDLFEGSCVYRVKGTNQFLALVECMGRDGGRRCYRAFTTARWRLAAFARRQFRSHSLRRQRQRDYKRRAAVLERWHQPRRTAARRFR
jgi:hypothetical protein